MIVLLLGAPGCGKTTQGERLFARMGLPQLICADLLHAAVASGVGPGAAAREALGAGAAVPNDVLVQIICEQASKEQCAGGFSLEGFPNTIEQAKQLDKGFASLGMRIAVCVLIDTGETDWTNANSPLLEFYHSRNLLKAIDGNPFVEEVEEQIISVLAETGEQVSGGPPPEPAAAPAAAEVPPRPAPTDVEPVERELTFEEQVKKVKWIDPRRPEAGGLRFASGKVSLTPTNSNSRVYGSNNRYREDMHRHERLKHDPCQKYPVPVTMSMDYGWGAKKPELYQRDPELFHPRMKSRETMYAESLILGPRHP